MIQYTYISETYVRTLTIRYSALYKLNSDKDYKMTKDWIRYQNARSYSYKYEFVPNSCIKKLFGNDTWNGSKSR
jgi:hypothetical protein